MQKALESLPGVATVHVDADKQTATCRVDPNKFDIKKAIATLDEAGYPDSMQVTPNTKGKPSG